jgi:hypothetical protein
MYVLHHLKGKSKARKLSIDSVINWLDVPINNILDSCKSKLIMTIIEGIVQHFSGAMKSKSKNGKNSGFGNEKIIGGMAWHVSGIRDASRIK